MGDPEDTRATPAFLRAFADPKGDSAPMPFWMWNGEMEEGEIRRQIGLMADAGVEAFVIHPREGLETPYLSDQWFAMVKAAVAEAMDRRMKVWIYDDLNWPSGQAGGQLIEADPTRCAHHLARVTVATNGRKQFRHSLAPGEQLVAAFALADNGGSRRIQPKPIDSHHSDDIPSQGERNPHFLIPETPKKTSTSLQFPIPTEARSVDLYISRPTSFSVTYRPGLRYTDLLDPEAVRLFISLTHQRYLRHLHDYLGITVLGFFTDEPGFYNNLFGCDPDTIPWTAGFAAHFLELKGYDLLPHLGALWQPPAEQGLDPEAARVRADFHDALADRYRTSYFEQLQQWCRANGLQLIGHLLGEEDLLTTARSQGDYFRHFRHLDMAGVDLVGRVSEEQSVSVRLGASAALHLGTGQLQSETFGIFGWGLTLRQMRFTTDWQAVRGLTRLIPHAFHYDLSGERHLECPPSLFFQNCWWPLYPGFQAYGRRLFAALEQGRPEAGVAVFYPMPSVWAELSAGPGGEAAARRADAAFRGLALALERAQLDFHILDAEMIGRAEVDGDGTLSLSGCRYQALVLPDCAALPPGMAEKLERFTRAGGLLAALGVLPGLELADTGGETDPLDDWSGRLFNGAPGKTARCGGGRTLFVPSQPPGTTHPAREPGALRWLRGLRRVGAAVAPRLEARATDGYKRWLSRKRDQDAVVVADSDPFAGLVSALGARFTPAIRVLPPDPEIRHLRTSLDNGAGGSLVFILNQGEAEKTFTATLTGPGHPWRLDPLDGSTHPVHRFSVDPASQIQLPLTLPPFGSALIFLDPSASTSTRAEETNLDEVLTLSREAGSAPQVSGMAWSTGKKWVRVVDSGRHLSDSDGKVGRKARQEWFLTKKVESLPQPMELGHGWEVHFLPMDGGQFDDPLKEKWPKAMAMTNQPLQDWRSLGRSQFSGTAEYGMTFELEAHHLGEGAADDEHRPVRLDLGDVRETVRVMINGRRAGDLLWPPYRLRVEPFLKMGENRLTLVVTNTMANRLESTSPASGLLGPVKLEFGQMVEPKFSPEPAP